MRSMGYWGERNVIVRIKNLSTNSASMPSAGEQDSIVDSAAEVQHRIDGLSLLLFVILLIFTTLLIWMFKSRSIRGLHETGVSMIMGAVAGFLIDRSEINDANNVQLCNLTQQQQSGLKTVEQEVFCCCCVNWSLVFNHKLTFLCWCSCIGTIRLGDLLFRASTTDYLFCRIWPQTEAFLSQYRFCTSLCFPGDNTRMWHHWWDDIPVLEIFHEGGFHAFSRMYAFRRDHLGDGSCYCPGDIPWPARRPQLICNVGDQLLGPAALIYSSSK